MDIKFSGAVPLLQKANNKCNVNEQNKQFDVEEGDISQKRHISQNPSPQINGQQAHVVQEILYLRRVQKVNANINLPKFKFTQEEVDALKRVKIQFNKETATIPTIQECQKFIQEYKACLYMFSDLKIDMKYDGCCNVPYIEYKKEMINFPFCCCADRPRTIKIRFLKDEKNSIITEFYSVPIDFMEQVSKRTNGLLAKMLMGESWVLGLPLEDWIANVADNNHISFPRYITNGLLSILRSRSESVETFASFLANSIDFYNLDAKSIYARVSSSQGLTDQERKAIMQYARAVRLE